VISLNLNEYNIKTDNDIDFLVNEYYPKHSEVLSFRPLSNPPTTFSLVVKIKSGPTIDYLSRKLKYKEYPPGWPFNEYANELSFSLILPPAFPSTHPICICESDVPHPNIIKLRGNVVCQDGIKKYEPSITMSVYNLLESLRNPNPMLGEYGCSKEKDDSIKFLKQLGFPIKYRGKNHN